MKPYQQHLPTPVRATFQQARQKLVQYGTFHWSEFKITDQDKLKLDIFFNNAVYEGILKDGHQQPRAWIGYQVVARLINKYIESAHKHGVRNWDVTVSEINSIVLIAATMARNGDVTLSSGYEISTGFYLKWDDVKATINRPVATLSNLEIVVHLRHTKDHKGKQNEGILRLLKPFPDDSTEHALDPCRWLLILAMRTGQTKPSLQDALDDALRRPDHLIVWNNPSFPVIPMRSKSSTHFHLQVPARTYQVLITMQEMGTNAGMQGRSYVHALRYGAARDMNHIPRSELDGKGFTDGHTRQAMNHTPGAQMAGTTDLYAGEPTIPTWNKRAEHADYPDFRRPKFTDDAIIPSDPQRAASHRTYHAKGSRRNIICQEEQDDLLVVDGSTKDKIVVNDEDTAFLRTCTSVGDEDTSCEGVLGRDGSLEQGDAIYAMTEEMLDDTTIMNAVTTISNNFVEKYATINIVKNDAWHQQLVRLRNKGTPFSPEISAVYSPDDAMQLGKDKPTPHIFACFKTTGCTYTTELASGAASHQHLCNESLVSARQDDADARGAGIGLPCPHEDCTTILANNQTLRNHIRDQHENVVGWVPKPCEKGCNPTHIYATPRQYKTHQEAKHSSANRFPVLCTFPECTDETKYNQLADIRRHLIEVHDIPEDDEGGLRPFLPKTGTTSKVWKRIQPCPMTIVSNAKCRATKFPSKMDMTRHLLETKAHSELTLQQAESLIEEHCYEIKENDVRIHKSFKVSRETVVRPKAGTRARGKHEKEDEPNTRRPTKAKHQTVTNAQRNPSTRSRLPSTMTSGAANDVITISDEEEDEPNIRKPTKDNPLPVTNAQCRPMTQSKLQFKPAPKVANNVASLSDDEDDEPITRKRTRTERPFYVSDEEPLHLKKKLSHKFPTLETSFDE